MEDAEAFFFRVVVEKKGRGARAGEGQKIENTLTYKAKKYSPFMIGLRCHIARIFFILTKPFFAFGQSVSIASVPIHFARRPKRCVIVKDVSLRIRFVFALRLLTNFHPSVLISG